MYIANNDTHCPRCKRRAKRGEPIYEGLYGYDRLCVVCYAELKRPSENATIKRTV